MMRFPRLPVFFVILLMCLAARPQARAAAPLYSIGNPTAEEQLYLEYINRARANPAAEGVRLSNTNDPDVIGAIQQFGVNLALFQVQMDAIPPSPPLAFNGKMIAAAREHAQDMLTNAFQDHPGTDGSDPGSRLVDQGYNWSAYGENVFSYSLSVLYGHAAFEIDWGGSAADGGMQTPPLHRQIIHSTTYREVGIGVADGTNGRVGPQVMTQDFAIEQGGDHPFLTGVVYADENGSGFYDAGEGIGGVTVTVTAANYYAVSAASGGYTVPLPNDGAYSVTFSGGGLPDLQKTITVSNGQNVALDYRSTLPRPTQFANIATRLDVETGVNALIGGFIITGSAPKQVLLRGIGPSLSVNGVPLPGALQNPTLELHDGSGKIIASNDDWQTNSNQVEISQSTLAPLNPREPALLVTLPANGSSYTAIVRGSSNSSGIGLVEIYDLRQATDSQLANISSRGLVQTNDNVMIGGFIITGSAPARVIVRALGPSLPVSGKLADPTLELVNSEGVSIQSNDNWRSDQEAEIIASTVPPTNNAEAAIVRTLPAGAYTAIVRGANGSSGVAVVEAYNLP
jgi:hypothetical protein